MVSTRGVRYKFTEGERVLCYEPDPTKAKVLYDSKVLEVIESKDKRGRRTVEYLIHFQGWNSSWDRCVGEGFVLKDTEENRQLQRDLAEKSQLQLGAYLYRRERKKGSTSSGGAGPTKRSRQGFSDDGSSSSTQPDEAEGEAEGSGQSRDTGDTDSSGSGSAGTPPPHGPNRAHIALPAALRDRLTFDYHLVVKRGRLSKLPASPCVAQILESYVKWFARAGAWHTPRTRADPPQKPDLLDVSCRLNLVREVADGLRVYFDFILRGHLLYKQEKDQYYQLCGQYIDEKEEPHIKEECDGSERSVSECTDEEMTSPRMPEYSHLPPDPDPGSHEENDEEVPETPPPAQTIEMHRIIIIKKEIKEEPDDQQEGVYEQELLIQMDIKEEQNSQDNREYYNQENQEYYHQEGYQEYEYQGEDNQGEQVYENQEEQENESQDQEDESQEDSENEDGDEEDSDNEESETQEDSQEDSQEYDNDEEDNGDEYVDQHDPEYEGEEDESSEEIEEEEEFEIELDEENYRNQLELRNQQLEEGVMLQEESDNVTPSNGEQLQVTAESGQQIASDTAQEMEVDSNQQVGNVMEMELRSGKHLDTTKCGKEKNLQPEPSNTSSTYMTLRRGKQISSKEENKDVEMKEIESIKQEPQEKEIGTELQDADQLETSKQLDTKQGSEKQASGKQIDIEQASIESDVKQSTEKNIDPKTQGGKQIDVKQGIGKPTHSKRKSGKQIDNETEKDKSAVQLELQKSGKLLEVADSPTIETRSAGKRKSGKQIDTLQEDDKPLSDIQISVKQGKEKQLDIEVKHDNVDQTEHKITGGKGSKGKHLDTKLENPKTPVDKRTGKGKQIEDCKQKQDECDNLTTPKSSGGKSGKGKHMTTKQLEKEACEKATSGKHMTLRQGSGKKSPVVEKREGKHIDTKQGSGKKLDEISGRKQEEGKKGSGKNVSGKQTDTKQTSEKHIEPLKGRGKQIFECPEDDNDIQDVSSRGGKEITLRSKGKELKHKGGKQLEVLQTGDKPIENPSEGKESGKHIESKHVASKEIKNKDTGEMHFDVSKSSGKHTSSKQTSGKEIESKESDEKQSIETEEKQTEGKRTGAEEVTPKQASEQQIEVKEASIKFEDKTPKHEEEEKLTGTHVKAKETEKKHAKPYVSGKQTEVKESGEKQSDVSEIVATQEAKDTDKQSAEENIVLLGEKQIKQEVESQDEELEDDKEQERRSVRKICEKHIDSQERREKKRGKFMSETEDKVDIKEEPFDEKKAIKLEIKEEREELNELDDPVEAGEGRATLHARRSLARRLRSHKSGVSQSENEDPLPSTSSYEPRPFEPVSSSVCSSGSSVSEGWRAPPTPAPAPAPPTRTPLSLLFEKVAKWQIIPREGTEHLPCRVYGAIHLARLFVKLPDFLNATQMPDHKLKLILKHIDMFVQFLDEHSEWFGEHYYYADNFGRTT